MGECHLAHENVAILGNARIVRVGLNPAAAGNRVELLVAELKATLLGKAHELLGARARLGALQLLRRKVVQFQGGLLGLDARLLWMIRTRWRCHPLWACLRAGAVRMRRAPGSFGCPFDGIQTAESCRFFRSNASVYRATRNVGELMAL